MRNVDMKVEGAELVIRVDLSEEGVESKSGKTLVIASSEGNVPVPGWRDIRVGLNCYCKPGGETPAASSKAAPRARVTKKKRGRTI